MAFDVRDIQRSSTGDATGFISGSVSLEQANVDMIEDSTWTGDVGSTGFTVGDIVSALKSIGVLAK